MHVDETGGHVESGGVDRSRRPAVDLADRGDAIPVNSHIGNDSRRPAAVEDGAAPDHQVVAGRASGEAHRQHQSRQKKVFAHAFYLSGRDRYFS